MISQEQNCGNLGCWLALYMSAPGSSNARVLRFDTFELNLHTGELRKRGIRLRLHGQPVQVLAKLALSAGNLVTREELRTQLWPADTFVDFDHSLHNAIARIRDVLGDSARKPRYIETLPRRGYRFIAPVEEVQPAAVFPDTNDETTHAVAMATPVAQQYRVARLILAVLTCAVIGLAAWMGVAVLSR